MMQKVHCNTPQIKLSFSLFDELKEEQRGCYQWTILNISEECMMWKGVLAMKLCDAPVIITKPLRRGSTSEVGKSHAKTING
ncbi:hypothetical protein [Geosporobacter ferrireducens]|uniref:hypothetical protein n=1 Tax=Geosporobacter ferrireducens TaxID=1424294 RepID=UPI00139B46DD|nr:hypothetical protein [Geosporobacter ferrireducens]MTI53820.1 hypothetical protein [Geosporobacter ferrireducens]